MPLYFPHFSFVLNTNFHEFTGVIHTLDIFAPIISCILQMLFKFLVYHFTYVLNFYCVEKINIVQTEYFSLQYRFFKKSLKFFYFYFAFCISSLLHFKFILVYSLKGVMIIYKNSKRYCKPYFTSWDKMSASTAVASSNFISILSTPEK